MVYIFIFKPGRRKYLPSEAILKKLVYKWWFKKSICMCGLGWGALYKLLYIIFGQILVLYIWGRKDNLTKASSTVILQ